MSAGLAAAGINNDMLRFKLGKYIFKINGQKAMETGI
jgi:hypothetical protein